jgi:hypothetical protein
MRHVDFRVGAEFRCGGRQWRCTDIGLRTIIAIRINRVEVGGNALERHHTLSGADAEAEGGRSMNHSYRSVAAPLRSRR